MNVDIGGGFWALKALKAMKAMKASGAGVQKLSNLPEGASSMSKGECNESAKPRIILMAQSGS